METSIPATTSNVTLRPNSTSLSATKKSKVKRTERPRHIKTGYVGKFVPLKQGFVKKISEKVEELNRKHNYSLNIDRALEVYFEETELQIDSYFQVLDDRIKKIKEYQKMLSEIDLNK